MDAVEELGYYGFIAYCLGYRRSAVWLNWYDVSRGYAKWLRSFLGQDLEGIWHTGVVAFGREYWFGGKVWASYDARIASKNAGKNHEKTLKIDENHRKNEGKHLKSRMKSVRGPGLAARKSALRGRHPLDAAGHHVTDPRGARRLAAPGAGLEVHEAVVRRARAQLSGA